jgi:DNA-binding CsgD family transcriptional regulator
MTAMQLHLSINTVRFYIKNLSESTDEPCNEAVAKALREHIVLISLVVNYP